MMNQSHEELDDMYDVSVIIPYYKCEDAIPALLSRLKNSLNQISENWEVILVDDRSPDNGWSIFQKALTADHRFKAIRLSRNFGQHPAITAGIHRATGRWTIVMDCDLQDRPEDIPKLYRHAELESLDIVIAQRSSSGLGKRRSFSSWAFNKVYRWMSQLNFSSDQGNFRIFSHAVAMAYRQYPERMRFLPSLMNEIGFNVGYLEVDRDERDHSPSSYSYRKLLMLALDSMISYSDRPLRYLAGFAVILCIFSFTLAGYYIIKTAILGAAVEGWTTLLTLITFFSGVQLFVMAFLGLYLGKVFEETKRRPIYLISDAINFKNQVR